MEGRIHKQARNHRGTCSQVSQAFVYVRTTYRRDDWQAKFTHMTALHCMQCNSPTSGELFGLLFYEAISSESFLGVLFSLNAITHQQVWWHGNAFTKKKIERVLWAGFIFPVWNHFPYPTGNRIPTGILNFPTGRRIQIQIQIFQNFQIFWSEFRTVRWNMSFFD